MRGLPYRPSEQKADFALWDYNSLRTLMMPVGYLWADDFIAARKALPHQRESYARLEAGAYAADILLRGPGRAIAASVACFARCTAHLEPVRWLEAAE